MGLFDTLLGRTKPAKANLDRLFGLPGAAVTLQAAEGCAPGHEAAVCFKPAAGPGFAHAEEELLSLLEGGEGSAGGEGVRVEPIDRYGYRWVVVSSPDFDSLVTRVHFVNSTLQDHGYGPQLLCSVFAFSGGDSTGSAAFYLVYLYKRGAFYPFVPLRGERRDNEAELRLKALLSDDLAIEPDLDRWFPLWELPIH